MDWLERISITCFAASYLVVLALEISRAVFRANWWKWIAISTSLAGIFAHVVYLTSHQGLIFDNNGIFVGGWTGWFLGAALVMMVAYLWVLFRQGDSIIGLFVVPLVLLAISIGSWPGPRSDFSAVETRTIWNAIHGMSLLLSTSIVGLGFLFGSMYLLQSRRLKRKNRVMSVRLPSLEWLQDSSEKSLVVSAVLLVVGVISGFAVNLVNRQMGNQILTWSDPVIWTSAILLGWLLVVLFFNFFYRSVRPGKKIAYLVMACFFFLVLEIGIVWYCGHAVNKVTQTATPLGTATEVSQQVQR